MTAPETAQGVLTVTEDDELRREAIAIVQQEARDLGYIDEDVADFAEPDGDDLLAVQAVERALDTRTQALAPLIEALEKAREALRPLAAADEAIDEIDPDFPSDGAALRASFDFYTTHVKHPESRDSVRRSDIRRAGIAFKQIEATLRQYQGEK